MSLWLILPLAILVSFILTAALRLYALTFKMIDVPNSRSSHSVPTPRGGGVAIVVTFLVGLSLLFATGVLNESLFWAALGSGLITALVGFFDDHGHVPARWRLVGHFGAACWALFWLQGAPAIEFFGVVVDLGWFGGILAILYMVWMLNLYNFMDGIDGIASVQAVTTCLGGAFIFWLHGSENQSWIALLLLCAVMGFLIWNFPPAKIFMGDAGSGFLGIMLALISLYAGSVDPQLLWSWLILLGVFVVDATWTLLKRMLRGEKVYEAHRSHAYQYASRYFKSHRVVTLFVLVVNIFWLLPVASLVGVGYLEGVVGLAVAYIPLVLLAIKYNAGSEEA